MTSLSPYAALVNTPPDTRVVGRSIEAFDSIGSTNEYALQRTGEGSVVVADCQTAGRGRHGRQWHSAPGLGLWFTVGFDSVFDGLTFASALAVCDATASHCVLKVKWPNDLLLNGRKICGILVERREGRTALGIGINVHHRPEDFPEDLRHKAGSLESETGEPWDRAELLRVILTQLDRKVILLQEGGFEEVREQWAAACGLVGRQIRFDGGQGVVEAIDGTGALVVATPAGAHRLLSGEIEVLDGV